MLIAAGADVEAGRCSGTTTLERAILSGDLPSVRVLLDAGADINAGRSLYAAVLQSDTAMVQLLIDHNADVNQRMEYANTALYAAARNGNVDVLKALLKAGADVSARNTSSECALHAAASGGHLDAANALVDAGAHVDVEDSAGRTPLALAVEQGHTPVVRLLISKGADLNTVDAQHRTPLLIAVSKDNVDLARILLAAGADPDAGGGGSYTTPLSSAVDSRRKDLVDLLLASGADPNGPCPDGTPLLEAVGGPTQPDIVAALLAAGASVNAVTSRGLTPLHLTVQRHDEALVKLLLKAKAHVDDQDPYGLTPLHYAASGRDEVIARLLLDNGADPNAEAKAERTPLHEAAGAGADGVVKLLIEHGADVNARDKAGHTPLDLAERAHATGCIELLEAAQGSGSDSTTRPKDAGTADTSASKTPGPDGAATPEPPKEERTRKRAWGPEQATGEPDTNRAGDIQTAWASLTRDGQDEWLVLEYAEAVTPAAVKVCETYNPGALASISVFDAEGEEHVVWKGEDPTPTTAGIGISEVSFTSDVKTKRLKLYIKSKEVAGWNEIDAVALVDDAGNSQWAVSATASSTYAERGRGPVDFTSVTITSGDSDMSYEDDLAAFIKEVDDHYPFFELKDIGDDWAEAKKTLLEEAKTCTSDPAFLGLVVKAIRCLRSGQMYILKAKAEIPSPPKRYYSGVSFLPATDGRVVVMYAPEQYKDALETGTVVSKIDGEDARTCLEERAKAAWEAGGSFSSPQRARLYEYRIPLRGPKGEEHTITAVVDDKEVDVALKADVEAGGWPHVYSLPHDMARPSASAAYAQLDSGAGYIYLRRVDTTTADAIPEALEKHADAKGWIIDLRGNGGGGYTAALIDQLKAIPKPVAVLIDAGTMGAGETLARDIAALTDAKLLGSKTAGSSSAKRTWTFPSGRASVVMPTRSRWRSDRKPIEFNGIDPDTQVEAVPEELQQGLNSAIRRAEEYLAAELEPRHAPEPAPAPMPPPKEPEEYPPPRPVAKTGGGVTGTVTHADTGEPAPGVTVWIASQVWPFMYPVQDDDREWILPPAVAVTDDEGHYHIDNASSGKQIVIACGEGLATPEAAVVQIGDPSAIRVDLRVSPCKTIQGVVIDAETGKPMPGVRIMGTVWAEGGMRFHDFVQFPFDDLTPRFHFDPESPLHVLTGDDGAFSLPYLAKAMDELIVWTDDYAKTRIDLSKADLSKPLRIELPRGCVLAGQVVAPDGTPLADAELLWARRFPRGRSRQDVRSIGHDVDTADKDGRFYFGGLSPGTYQLIVRHPDYARVYLSAVSLDDKTDFDQVITLGVGARVSGTVAAEDGGSIEGGTVRFAKADDDVAKLDWSATGEAIISASDWDETFEIDVADDGTFRSPPLRAGAYYVLTDSKSYWFETPAIVELAEGDLKNVAITLKPKAPVRGRLVDAAGEPVRNAFVWTRRPQGPLVPTWTRFYSLEVRTMSGKDGTFELMCPGAGRYRIWIHGSGYNQSPDVEAPVDDLEIVLGNKRAGGTTNATGDTTKVTVDTMPATPTGSIMLTVTDAETGAPIKGAMPSTQRMTLLNPNSLQLLVDFGHAPETGPDGKCRVPEIPFGTNTLTVLHRDYAETLVAFTLGKDDGVKPIAAQLHRGSGLRGRVVSRVDQSPVPGVGIMLVPEWDIHEGDGFFSGLPNATTKTDDNGAFNIEHIAPGRYVLAAVHDEYARHYQDITMGDADREVAVELGTGGVLLGTITGPDGEHVAEGDVEIALYRPTGFRVHIFRPPHGFADESGAYAVGWIPPGVYGVEAYNYDTGEEFSTEPVLIHDGEEVRLDITLTAGHAVSGRITSDGSPVPGAEVSVFVEGAMSIKSYAGYFKTGDEGRYHLAAVAPGSYLLKAYADTTGFAFRRLRVTDSDVQVDVELTEGRHVVTGTILDHAGDPVPNRLVRLVERPADDGQPVALWAPGPFVPSVAPTDEHGRFALLAPEPGRYLVDTSWVADPVPVDVGEGSPSPVTVQFPPLSTIRLHVSVPGGPFPDWVSLAGSRGPARLWGEWFDVDPDTGEATIEDVPAGTIEIVIMASGLAPIRKTVTVEPGDDMLVEAAFERGSLLGILVQDEAGAPLPGALLGLNVGGDARLAWDLIDESLVIDDFDGHGPDLYAGTLLDGTAEMRHVADGTYTLHVRCDGYKDAAMAVTVAGKDTGVSVTLKRASEE